MINHRVMFLRDQRGQPVGCIAIKASIPNEIAWRLPEVSYQISVLNPTDRFNRAVARQLALGRLIEQPIHVDVCQDPSMHDITRAVMSDIVSDKLAPGRARKAANLWIKTGVIPA